MENRNYSFTKRLKTAIIGIVSLALLGFLSLVGAMLISMYRPAMHPIVYEPARLETFPTQAWQLSTPEERGLDSAKLLELVAFYEEKNAENENIVIDSITIVRNGAIVADIYLNPLFPPDTQHILHSCTKSVVSALVGIAIEKGYIESVEVPVVEILSDKNLDNADERIKALTLENLLTMQTGLHAQDSYLYGYWQLFELQKTEDWTEYILNLPFEIDPGTRFDYSNMASFLLSAVIKKATGRDTLEFARAHLFDPLGIQDVRWEKSPQGIDIGWARMWLKPRDMAKFGLLYLQKGQWDGEQIIPEAWIDDSLTAHSVPKRYRYIYTKENKVDYGASGGLWAATNLIRPFADGYGYQWWLDKSGRYAAFGTGGQYIMVLPQENMVVFTSQRRGPDAFFPATLLDKFILPSVRADETIAANEPAQQQLARLSKAPELVLNPKPIPALPDTAQRISGVTYSLEPNPLKYDDFKLEFDLGRDYATFSDTAKENDEVSYHVGLDKTYPLTDASGGGYAARGFWTTANSFVIDFEQIGYSTKGQWVLSFDGESIIVEEAGVVGTHRYKGQAQHVGY